MLASFHSCNEIIDRLAFTAGHKSQMADAALGQADQALAKRRQVDSIADRQSLATRFVLTRCNSLCGHKQIMQASQAGKPHLVGGVQQVFGPAEQFLGAFLGQELQKTLGTDPGPAGEQSLKVILAQTDARGNLLQAGLLLIMVFKVQDRLLDAQVIFRALFEIEI